MEKPLVDQHYLLQKFQGKGGWTYAEIPEILQNNDTPFGWVRVKGFIDDYEIAGHNLMPMGNGKLMLPVKTEIRKKIKKEEGDTVHLVLFEDKDPIQIPDELKECLEVEGAFDKFCCLPKSEKKYFLNWIYSSKKEETKVERIARTIDKVLKGKKFSDK